MKHRMPFLLWIMFQSLMGAYATDCTLQADSLFKQAKAYDKQRKTTQDPNEQRQLLLRASESYDAAILTAIEASCQEQFQSLADANIAYAIGVKAINLKEQEAAITLLKTALKIRKDSLQEGDKEIVKCYANLSMAHRQLLRYDEAESFVKKGFMEAEKLVGVAAKMDKFVKAYLYHEGAQLYLDKGDSYEALKINAVAWNLFQEIGSYVRSINSGNQRGVIYEKIKESEAGISLLKEVETLSKGSPREYLIKRIYQGLGNMYLINQDYPEAISYYKLAIDAAQNDANTLADCRGNMGLVYRMMGDYANSLEQYQAAIDLDIDRTHDAKRRLFLANNYSGIAETYRAMEDFDAAFKAHQEALALLIKSHNKEDFYASPGIETSDKSGALRFLIDALTSKAKTHLGRFLAKHTEKDLQAASEHFYLAITLIDQMRVDFQEDDSKLSLMKDVYDTYEGAIEVAFYQGNSAFAFQLSEKAKATLLYASMMEKEAKSFADIPQEAMEEEKNLKRSIAILEQKRDQLQEGDTAYQEMLDELLSKKRELAALIEEFGRKYPDYYRIKYDTELVDVAEIQSQLGDSTLMIEYFAGDEKWFAFALSKDHIEMREMNPLKDEIQEYAALLPHTESWINEVPAGQKELFDCLGNQLYEELMGGLWDKNQWKYSIIIPDREIYYLPIDALLTQKPKEQLPVSLYPFLLKDMAASYDFSAKLWLKGITRKSSTGWFQKGFLAFAPDFTPISKQDLNAEEKKLMNQDFFKGRSEPDSSTDLIPLLASKDEIERVQELLGGEIFPAEGKKGLLGRFIKEAPSYRFIHLGTHGIFNKYNSKYSYLAFQPVEDNIDNERLYLSDLYNLNLDAELVVLSACETQAGELLPGEGIASLAQGFTYAGAKSIVATLWSVQNASNAELMKRFYQNLIEGDNKALALQKAKISMNREGSSYGPPFYWAAPAVIGSTAPINPPSPILRYLLLSVSLLMACSLGFVLINRNRKFNG